MKRISKCCVVIALAAILAFNCSVFSNAYTSQAAKAKPKTQTVTVTKNSGFYTGVVKLTRYTSHGVKKVKNGKVIKLTLRKRYEPTYTFAPWKKTLKVTFSKNKKSYTLTGKGHLSSLDDQKGQNVKVTIKGFK